jgi:hypothetical protein
MLQRENRPRVPRACYYGIVYQFSFLLLQCAIESGAAIGATAGLMHLSDPVSQGCAFRLTLAGAATYPGVVTGAGDTTHTAHEGDGVVLPGYFDEPEDFRILN